MDPIIVEDLSFSYTAEQLVLQDINFRVKQGEWVAIAGHNGSGKSTLAKCLNGLLMPKSGEVITCGRNTKDKETIMDLRRRAGMVFQQPDNQLVAPTVADDVAFGLENAGIPFKEMQERVKESIHRMKLDGLEDREPHRLSGGQKQRVALAGITALRPEVIILDEATSMLDPVGRQEVQEMMRTLCREEGITIVSITHDVEEASEADRMLVMHEGRLLADDTPREIFRQQEVLVQAKLTLPLPVKLSRMLREEGIRLPQDIMSEQELVDALCEWK
ncbi:energy-coupling factor transporter ATPase [Alkalicoccus daliensis]|uniref:Energy-coupling factor transport system ATP-binding protein n=1 Tax=Alkalicoccus daliensis TaxID=745820 RepID=A0A1H0F908_9BACI|nr:energy-coupling factor transporter ATPase [Alkalicoccus daliensis]SDN91080.1 energy-coupling factor transport system ATP-binding protein [Alkalicoccus daliensis]